MMNKPFTTGSKRLFATAFILLCAMGSASTTKAESALAIDLDGMRSLTLKAPAKDVIIGNPAIADVTLQSPTHLVIMAHQPGRTRLLALDADQKTILDQIIVVTTGDVGLLTVYGPRHGTMKQESYACGYHCTLMPSSGGSGSSSSSSSSSSSNVGASGKSDVNIAGDVTVNQIPPAAPTTPTQ